MTNSVSTTSAPRTTHVALVARFDIGHATVLEHLRKAEAKVIDAALADAAPVPEISLPDGR